MSPPTDDDYSAETRRVVQLQEMLDVFHGLPESMQAKLVRFIERLAALPCDVQLALTQEQASAMFESDSDFPYN